MRFLAVVPTLLVMALPGHAQGTIAWDDYVKLIRADLRAQKVEMLGAALQMDEKESEAFWPIYGEYAEHLANHFDERMELIKQFADAYYKITEDDADKIVKKAFDLQRDRLSLQEKYFRKLRSAVSPLTAARFIQLENKINLLIDLEIAAEIPLVPKSAAVN